MELRQLSNHWFSLINSKLKPSSIKKSFTRNGPFSLWNFHSRYRTFKKISQIPSFLLPLQFLFLGAFVILSHFLSPPITKPSFFFCIFWENLSPENGCLFWGLEKQSESERQRQGNTNMLDNANWELKNCCNRDQVRFLVTIGVFTVVILAVSFSLFVPITLSFVTLVCFLGKTQEKLKQSKFEAFVWMSMPTESKGLFSLGLSQGGNELKSWYLFCIACCLFLLFFLEFVWYQKENLGCYIAWWIHKWSVHLHRNSLWFELKRQNFCSVVLCEISSLML